MSRRRRGHGTRVGTRVVLPPELPFTAVHAAFVEAGWTGGPIMLTPPMVAGEPELARYRNGESVATYTADPVMWLRTVTTADPLPLPGFPVVAPTTVLTWLADDGADEVARERRLLGVVAAGELGLAKAVPRLRLLGADEDDPLLAAAARRALSILRKG